MTTYKKFSSAVLLILVHGATVVLLHGCFVCGTDCEVEISFPWEAKIFIPWNSSVLISCTADTTSEPDIESSLEWSIRLPDRQIDDDFTNVQKKKILNNRGFFELPPTAEATQLIINNTDGINGTVLKCADILSGNLLQETTLLVYESILINITQARDIAAHSVNLSWTSVSETVEQIEQGTKLNYRLRIVTNSGKISSQSRQLQESFYRFTAPEGAPPCEIYNFSVTATYVGASYTGAGCSVPSQVLSKMLPSLPDIARLELTLKYSLRKNLSGRVILRVTFMPANYCEMYPVDGYMLEVEGPTSHSSVMQSPSTDTLTVNNLLDDQVYSFSVVVSNTVGNISTGNRNIYSTDVQMITALAQEDNRFILQCHFMDDSPAQGCMVVLVSSFGRENRTLIRNGTQPVDTVVNVIYPISCYTQAYGYDIDSDGSVGTLAVPGAIVRNSSSIALCVPEELKPRPSQNIPAWAIIIIGVILGVALVSMTVILVFVIAYRLVSRCRMEKHSNYYHVSSPSPTASARPVPVTPPPAPTQDFTDEGDDAKKPQPIYDQPEQLVLPKEEHIYHVLETSMPRYQFKREDFSNPGNGLIPPHDHNAQSPAHSESDCSPFDPPPLYQDITDVPLVRGRHSNGRAGASGRETCSPSTELNSAPSQPPVYQEITELPTSRASFGLHDRIL